jgi:antitoxin (DNA-binding transcriptional repressor) of toxin-antitoxin stability system
MTTTLPLRELLRQPAKVKKLIAAGHSVRITDRGRPLWRMDADRGPGDEPESRIAASWDAELEELEQEIASVRPALSAATLLIQQRSETLR